MPGTDDDVRLCAEALALDAAYAEAERFDAARAARCVCGWCGPLDALEDFPEEDANDGDWRVLWGACPKCMRAVYAPDPEDAPEDWDRIAGDKR